MRLITVMFFTSPLAIAFQSVDVYSTLTCKSDWQIQIDNNNQVVGFTPFLNGGALLKIPGLRKTTVDRLKKMKPYDEPMTVSYIAPDGHTVYLKAVFDKANIAKPYKMFGEYAFEGRKYITQTNCKFLQ